MHCRIFLIFCTRCNRKSNVITQLDGTISPGEIEFAFGSRVYGNLLLSIEESPPGCLNGKKGTKRFLYEDTYY